MRRFRRGHEYLFLVRTDLTYTVAWKDFMQFPLLNAFTIKATRETEREGEKETEISNGKKKKRS